MSEFRLNYVESVGCPGKDERHAVRSTGWTFIKEAELQM